MIWCHMAVSYRILGALKKVVFNEKYFNLAGYRHIIYILLYFFLFQVRR